MSKDLILALDQGTTSTRAIAFRAPRLAPAAVARRDLAQHFPRSGWVEHEGADLYGDSVAVLRDALAQAGGTAADVAAIGITNQRETTLIWNRTTGEPIHRAIVWQDRRTASACAALRDAGHEALITGRTGLLIDPYFCATKVAWLLDNVGGARDAALAGDLAFGTVDTWLLWCLTGGHVHATDATNASRTMLYDIRRGTWDDDLLELFRIPRALLPDIRDSSGLFGHSTSDVLGAEVPIMGIAGDQQAAMVGQACFEPGMVKSTYGTGCFLLLNTGGTPVASQTRMLTTVACQINGRRTYALEGAIFVAGAAVQWLRDGIGIIKDAAETGALAADADAGQSVYLVPAFTGLGAPHWDADARGAMFGLTRNTGPAEFARAALESVGYQTRDLISAMRSDWAGASDVVLRVDGGMVASDWTMQFLADMLGAPVDRPVVLETTALGAAYLAGLAADACPPPDEFSRSWALQRRFEPHMTAEERDRRYAGWQDAVRLYADALTMTDERIARVEPFIVTLPRDVPYLGALPPGEEANARGYFVRRANRTVYPIFDRSILVRVTTASGVVGWGETYGLIAPRATTEILNDLFAPFTIDRDPRDPAVLHDDLRDLMRVRGATGGFYGDALAALDIAVWDVAARLAGVPLYRLLGGKRRDRIPAYLSGLPMPTLAGRVEMAAEWAGRGFDAFKFAAAVSDEGEVAELRALRERLGPAARIGVDLHWRYTAAEALALIGRLAAHGLFFAEAPVASDDIAGLLEVARRSPVAVAAGEEWYALPDAAARLPGPAIVQPEMAHAGVTEFMRIAGLAEAHGARVMPHATVGLGIFLAASLHASAALRSVTLHEYQHSIFDRNVRFLDGGLRMDGTQYVVPEGAGLGVSPAESVWPHAERV